MKSSAFALFLGAGGTGAAGNAPARRRRRRAKGRRRFASAPAAICRRRSIAPRPGDVIELASGATFTGNFVLPAKPGNRYTILRTAPTAGLPDASSRIDPSHSGKLARIQSPNSVAGAAHGTRRPSLAPDAARVRTQRPRPPATSWCSATHRRRSRATRDASRSRRRSLLHPWRSGARPEARHRDEWRVDRSSSAPTSPTSSPTSQDAQAIAGWSGPGPFRVENNYLEASGENFMLGGATAGAQGLVPSDLVFRRNHVSRPVGVAVREMESSRTSSSSRTRGASSSKAISSRTTGSTAQPGYAIVFTPRGEGGAAPWATIEDVTFRYNIIRNVAAGFNLLARDDNGASGTMRRVRIADNLIIAHRPRRSGVATAPSCRSARGPPRSSSSTTRSCRPTTC